MWIVFHEQLFPCGSRKAEVLQAVRGRIEAKSVLEKKNIYIPLLGRGKINKSCLVCFLQAKVCPQSLTEIGWNGFWFYCFHFENRNILASYPLLG